MTVWKTTTLAVLAFAVSACGTTEQEATNAVQPAAVRTVPAASVQSAAQTRAVGTLAPRDEIRLAFKVGGVVDSVSVESGDIVRKGQVLAELKRAEVDATVAQAAEGVEKARRDLERARQLRIDEVATEEQVQDLTTAYNVARSNLDAARFNARFARIEAPADGIVFERTVEAGELVQPGQPVVVLGSTSSGWVVRAGLSDRDVMRMETGAVAEVTFDAFSGPRVYWQGDAHRRGSQSHERYVRSRDRGAARRHALCPRPGRQGFAATRKLAGRGGERERRAHRGAGRGRRHARHALHARRADESRTPQAKLRWARCSASRWSSRPDSPLASSDHRRSRMAHRWPRRARRRRRRPGLSRRAHLGIRGPSLAVHAAAVRPVARGGLTARSRTSRARRTRSSTHRCRSSSSTYPGADPADIERLIVDPIEDAISELDEIKRMDSRSLDGVGIIQVEFHWDQDPDEKYDEVVREVNRVRADLPPDIASLEVRRTGSGLVNIMQVALVSPDASYRELDDLGRALSDQIETLPGVRRSRGVRIAGARGARRDRSRAHGARRRHARPGGSRSARRERRDSRRRGRPGPAQVQPEDLGQLRLARGDRGHDRREPRRPAWCALRDIADVQLGHDRAAVHRALQRPARDLRDGQREGSRGRVRRARRHRDEARRLRAATLPPQRPTRARLRPDTQRRATA